MGSKPAPLHAEKRQTGVENKIPHIKMPKVAKSPLAASSWNQDVGLGLEIREGGGSPSSHQNLPRAPRDQRPKSLPFPTENRRVELPTPPPSSPF